MGREALSCYLYLLSSRLFTWYQSTKIIPPRMEERAIHERDTQWARKSPLGHRPTLPKPILAGLAVAIHLSLLSHFNCFFFHEPSFSTIGFHLINENPQNVVMLQRWHSYMMHASWLATMNMHHGSEPWEMIPFIVHLQNWKSKECYQAKYILDI